MGERVGVSDGGGGAKESSAVNVHVAGKRPSPDPAWHTLRLERLKARREKSHGMRLARLGCYYTPPAQAHSSPVWA